MAHVYFPKNTEELKKTAQSLIWEDEIIRITFSKEDVNHWIISYEDLEEKESFIVKTEEKDNHFSLSQKEGALFEMFDRSLDNDREKIAAMLRFLYTHSTVLDVTIAEEKVKAFRIK